MHTCDYLKNDHATRSCTQIELYKDCEISMRERRNFRVITLNEKLKNLAISTSKHKCSPERGISIMMRPHLKFYTLLQTLMKGERI